MKRFLGALSLLMVFGGISAAMADGYYPGGQCLNGYCVGERAINISRDNRYVAIIAIANDGTFALRYEDTNAIGTGWSYTDLAKLSGCSRDLCVGAEAVNVSRDNRLVAIEAIDAFGKYVLRYQDTRALGKGWDRSDLAVLSGCATPRLCVGTRAYNVSRDSRVVEVFAIQYDGKVVLRYADTRALGSGWSEDDLAFLSGCTRDMSFCVGDRAINRSRNNRFVNVVGIQTNDLLVLQYEDTGALGSGWSSSDLIRLPN